MTIGVDLGDVWSHYCTLNRDGEVVDRGRFRSRSPSISAPAISHQPNTLGSHTFRFADKPEAK